MSSQKPTPAGEQARTPAQIYAEIEALQQLGGIEHWHDRRQEAERLLNEAIELPGFESRIKVVRQRSKGEPGWKRINIQRGNGARPLCNPYEILPNGERTAEMASDLFWEGFKEQIKQDTPQRLKMLELQSLLQDGTCIELGCCGDEHCHGHLIREELIENWDPMDPRLTWLWDVLHPLPELVIFEDVKQVMKDEPIEVDVEQWAKAVSNLLKEGWQQFDRFKFKCDYEQEIDVDGDLAARATSLWMEYDFLESTAKGERFFELFELYSELESHIDPDNSIQEGRQAIRNQRKADELRKNGNHAAADLWLQPKEQWKRPPGCSVTQWENIIRPFNREHLNEPLEEFLAKIELARLARTGAKGMSYQEALETVKQDPHTRIRELVETGASAVEIQEFINQQPRGYNQAGLAKFAEQCSAEQERRQDLTDALEGLLLRGTPPAIALEDYVPAEWIPMFRVLREGLKFSDEAIVMTIAAGVAAMLPPRVRIKAWSLEEVPTIWLFHIGTSGTAKSVLLRKLINGPMEKPRAAIDALNKRDLEARDRAKADGEDVPEFRCRNLIYTSPTTQGIRADLAVHGEEVPGLLVRDELNGWLKQMAGDNGAGVGDIEFWLSSYDSVYSNDVFADARRSREVRTGKLGVIGCIQPDVFLQQLDSGNTNGFNSRPLFVHLPRPQRVLMKDDAATEELSSKLGQLYLDSLEFGLKRFVLSKEAEALFESLFNQLENLSIAAGSEEVEALWAKGPGQTLRMAAAVHFMRIATGMEEITTSQSFITESMVVSARSLQLAANLVMAGKTRAVELHERAANPMLDRADKLLESARKRQGKAPSKGVLLSEIRKQWNSHSRPTLLELKQMSRILQTRGIVQVLDGGKSIRVVR